ncbi:hypothetical protein Vadar_007972 [Vaccinium darrowii]|uniref:Uncharacterized protein n=1 Tax=Vaccinium darrowii TaxID=229202 RepID=A0ACB7Z397_9ERIC|nr:hypothetical protein Vadar_007972 [Vaccinium darrowii]
MLELSLMLKNETAAMNTPKRPAFSTRGDEDEVQESTPHDEIWSVDGIVINGSAIKMVESSHRFYGRWGVDAETYGAVST